MGGFLGIGKSAEAKELERQNALKQQEADRARKEAEVRLAEKKAKKGQETANIKLGAEKKAIDEEEQVGKTKSTPSVSGSLALGGAPKKKTGLQV